MENQVTSWIMELGKVLGGAGGGTIVGYFAQKKAAKSEAVTEMQLLKGEYKEFAEYTKTELESSRHDRAECQRENEVLSDRINELKTTVNTLEMTIHNAIGTPKDKRKGLNKDKGDA